MSQVVLFLLVAANIEAFAYDRLLAEGFETSAPLVGRDRHGSLRFRATSETLYTSALVKTNDEGLRDEDIDGPPPSGELRIMCVGDSATFGDDLETRHTYPRLLETILQEQVAEGTRLRVINGGQPGFAAYDGAGLADDLVRRYRPNIVTAMFGFNDVNNRYIYRTDEQAGRVDWVRDLFQCSASYRYLCDKLQPVYEPRHLSDGAVTYSDSLEWWQRTAANLLTIDRMVRGNGGRLLIIAEGKRRSGVIPPGHDQASWEAMKKTLVELGRDHDIPVLVVDDVVAASGQSEQVLFRLDNPVHLTTVGSRLLAQSLADRLLALGWVPGRRSSRFETTR